MHPSNWLIYSFHVRLPSWRCVSLPFFLSRTPKELNYFQGREVDLLFGLDMLKAHQACIDLEKNVLRIQGREVRFLSEHELPDKARDFESEPSDAGPSSSTPSGNNTDGPAFPGSGQALGTRPSTSINPVRRPPTSARPSQSRIPEKDIAALGRDKRDGYMLLGGRRRQWRLLRCRCSE